MKKILLILVCILALTACAAPAEPTRSTSTRPTEPLTGWHRLEDGTYFFDELGDPCSGWLLLDIGTYYLDEGGKMVTGWLSLEEGTFYLEANGRLHHGFLTLEGETYYFAPSGALHTGWLEDPEGTYWFDGQGKMATGWVTVEGVERYFGSDGRLYTGWLHTPQGRCFLDSRGAKTYGWLDWEEKRYFLGEEGFVTTGWLEQAGSHYYFHSDGTMARGEVKIGEESFFFTSTGKQVLLVNPWNYLPQDYTAELTTVGSYYADSDFRVAQLCKDALLEMMAACNAQSGGRVYAISGYRSYETQVRLYNNKVAYWQSRGYSLEDAKVKAATSVAVPGTSEHHTGLAVDIIDTDSWDLTEVQATLAGQQWLMEHCWEYGFILRYPVGSTDSTGIIYEPWHYRYVGVELALELRDAGCTLEEYMAALTGQGKE